MAARDGLLWIGHSYDRLDCGAAGDDCVSETCCFVHEAIWRGISRKLPAVPEWAVPGETRIFLAHRNGHETTDLGKIYGYFTLHRIELIDDTGSRSAGVSQPPCPATGHQDQVTDAIVDHLWDGALDRHAPTVAPIEAERLTDERLCRSGEPRTGWRESAGAIYVVDALCADVTDAWAELVRCVDQPDFARLVDRLGAPDATSRRPTPQAPEFTPARIRAGLVLFAQPPDWQAFPVASCQSLIQIDGDHLLEQVKTGPERVKVLRHAKPRTRRDIEVQLACECGVNLELAHRFVGKLLDKGLREGRIERYKKVVYEIDEARLWIRTDDDFPLDALIEAVARGEGQLAGHHDELAKKCDAMVNQLAKHPVWLVGV